MRQDLEFNPGCIMTTMEAPWLDKQMLELWLQAPVKEIHSEDSSQKGDNYLSNMKRLEVKTENGQVFPLVVKCRLEEGYAADVFRESSAYKREQEMYSNILNKMSQLLHDAFPGSLDEFAPKCYYACKTFFVMEDLIASGFKMEDRRKGLDLDTCLLVMHTLAKFHASSVILHQQNPGIFAMFGPSLYVEDSIMDAMKKIWPGLLRSLAEELDSWDEKWHKYAVKVRYLAENLMERVKEVIKCRDSEFNVLSHGDLWTCNILLRNETGDVRFIDYQSPHLSSPAIDLNYFLSTSLSLDVNRNHRDRLVKEYHNTLCKTLTALGYKEKLITLEELNKELDKKAFWGLFSLMGPCAMMLMRPDSGYSFDEALATGQNPGPIIYDENYREVIKMLLPLYDSKGAFDMCD